MFVVTGCLLVGWYPGLHEPIGLGPTIPGIRSDTTNPFFLRSVDGPYDGWVVDGSTLPMETRGTVVEWLAGARPDRDGRLRLDGGPVTWHVDGYTLIEGTEVRLRSLQPVPPALEHPPGSNVR